MYTLRRLDRADLPRLQEFWIEHWGSLEMIAHGEVFHPDQLEGFVAEENGEWMGLVTFYINNQECEIITVDSLREERGIGTQLLKAVIEEARGANCRRVFLITTNDNLRALGFYQKRGFELAALHRGAVNETRKIKPEIPSIGYNGIPLRDEIELELNI